MKGKFRRKFKYENNGGEVHIEAADMDMQDFAVEIGTIVNSLHNSLMRQSSIAAKQFQLAMMMTIMPGSPVWQEKERGENDSCTMVMVSK